MVAYRNALCAVLIKPFFFKYLPYAHRVLFVKEGWHPHCSGSIVVRIFNSYVPARSLVLLLGEIAAVCVSFSLAIVLSFGGESRDVFANQQAIVKILAVAFLAFLCSHYLELHDLRRLNSQGEIQSRILKLVGILSLLLAAVSYLFPEFKVGRYVFLTGLIILAVVWSSWRWAYVRLIALRAFRERVYLLGNGERALRIREAIESRSELGMDLVGVSSGDNGHFNIESFAKTLTDLQDRRAVDRVIVALADRRSIMPVNELLNVRLHGIRVEDGTSILEKVTGKIEVDELHPSWLIFGDGFHLTQRRWFLRRIISTLLALALTILTLPLIPIVTLLIKLTSPGPILYRQKRVGLRGRVFDCFKFRTMRCDAEADSGPTWASDDDPRITRFGKFLRRSRLDEIPQIWNVLRGDMAFVGPRPERPEFVTKLSQEIPYYNVRHAARPGITGWAQINYGYGSSVEEAKEKLRFDLYYIRNISVMLDLLIVFYTLRAVIIGRGVR
jgi:sugar transferase (PEP-CTERM system associated)